MALDISPVSGALGAEIRGVDLRALDDATFREVRDVLHEYEVIFFREVALEPDEQMALARRFGSLSVFPMSRLLGATEPTFQVITDGPDSPPEADDWHTDVTWIATPPKYALLHAEVVPERGGDKLWASMTAAHDALSPTMQRLIAGLEVVHDNESFIAGMQRKLGVNDKSIDLAKEDQRIGRGTRERKRTFRPRDLHLSAGPRGACARPTRRCSSRSCAPTPTPAAGSCSSAVGSCAGSTG